MKKEIIEVSSEDIEIFDYKEDTIDCFSGVPEIAYPLLLNARKNLKKIEQMLYTTPSFMNMIKSAIPENTYQAIFTGKEKRKLANGAIKLMTKKDGTLLANLVDTKTNKVVSNVSLNKVNFSPELTNAITNFATQMQMAEIAEQIRKVQLAIEEVRQGQEFDRLATAYSCQQKLLQALEINNPELKAMALLRISLDAEDSRNLLMQSQNINLEFIKNQPESFWGKLMTGATQEKINDRINEIRESLSAVNMVSLVEAIAYQEMGEPASARQSLLYYADYIEKAYLETKGFVEKLDLIDESPENYWTKILPQIKKKINELPCIEENKLIEGE